jgi:hypothetical protein
VLRRPGPDGARPRESGRRRPARTRLRESSYGLSSTTRNGWHTVSYKLGPDDDVDAVFANRKHSIEVDVYCNQGQPTLSDFERKTLPDD